ncbi:MAG: RNA polymerase sigma factor [Rhodoplanes sp.]|uniref:RNA polymerase sigma factor n=1 Tax=Rhodoplanes sp. TaxID=1968906 RepID=UPI0017FB4DC4|nr:RNA polymerase sigma factor [Rhodoplanes sp.]NVO17641.1 RNA polymerase sigma factor [Rhodoplanes sp.]
MTGEAPWGLLRDLLVERYTSIRQRLSSRLGSSDLAAEALHETWLRLSRGVGSGPVERPESYLFRIALNVAADLRKVDGRRLAPAEIEQLRQLDGHELDPERTAAARFEVAALTQALTELPPRCRAVFVAVRVNGEPTRVVAERLGLSVRMVERDVKRTLEHVMRRLGRTGRVAPEPPEPPEPSA